MGGECRACDAENKLKIHFELIHATPTSFATSIFFGSQQSRSSFHHSLDHDDSRWLHCARGKKATSRVPARRRDKTMTRARFELAPSYEDEKTRFCQASFRLSHTPWTARPSCHAKWVKLFTVIFAAVNFVPWNATDITIKNLRWAIAATTSTPGDTSSRAAAWRAHGPLQEATSPTRRVTVTLRCFY